MDYIGIGWDVGGWMGDKNAVAAVAWHSADDALQWRVYPRKFKLPRSDVFNPANNELLKWIEWSKFGKKPLSAPFDSLGIDGAVVRRSRLPPLTEPRKVRPLLEREGWIYHFE